MTETKQEITFDELYNDLSNNYDNNDYVIQKLNSLNLNGCNFLPYQKKFLEGYLLQKQRKYEDAFKCFQESNEIEENGYALNKLAICYESGEGVKKNIDEAIRLYKLAIEKGNINAMYNLAECYYFRKGVEKNINIIIKLLKEYYEKSNDRDFNILIKCYNALPFNQKYYFYNSLSKNSPVLEQLEKSASEIDCLKFKLLKLQEKVDELEKLMYLPPYADPKLHNGGPGFQQALLSRNDFDE